MKQFIVQIVAIVVVILIGVYLTTNTQILGSYLNPFFRPPNITTSVDQQLTTSRKIKVEGALLNVDVADTDEKRIKGFSGVESIPENYGILFVFDQAEVRTFWMKGVKFPLDLIWIKGDTVLDITPNVQPPTPNQPDDLLPRYQSNEPVDKVLEILGGGSSKYNIKVGDKIISAQ